MCITPTMENQIEMKWKLGAYRVQGVLHLGLYRDNGKMETTK